MNLLLVFLGGGIGSLCRYFLNLIFLPTLNHWGTFTINNTGSFFIGAIGALALKYPMMVPAHIKLLIITGILSGFTTFSSFQLELLLLFKDEIYFQYFLYATLSLITGSLSVALGFYIIQLFKI